MNSLRTVLCNHVEKIEKAVKGKAVKSLQQRYQQKERTGGKVIADLLDCYVIVHMVECTT